MSKPCVARPAVRRRALVTFDAKLMHSWSNNAPFGSEDDGREISTLLCFAAGGRARRLLRLHQSLFPAVNLAAVGEGIRRKRRTGFDHHHREHASGGPHRTLHRGCGRRIGPQAGDHRGDVCAGIPTVMVALSTSLTALIFWRAVQGLVLPPIFAVMVAYIGDELPRHEATTVAGIYSSGSSLGGFSGRLFTGLLADLVSWRAGFMALAVIAFAGAIAVAFLLPHERKFVRSEGLLASNRQMLAHLRNKQLIATYAVGFAVLFNFIATF